MHLRPAAVLLALGLTVSLAPAAPGSPQPEGVWLAGDLHVHSIWSKDVCETPQLKNTRDASKPNEPCDDPTTWGHPPEEQLAIANARGLDYLALTDHNTNRHLTDPAVVNYTGPVTVIPGVELTLDGGEGHANLFNWTLGKPVDPTPADGRYTADDMQSIAARAHAEGALFSVNHPINPAWGLGFPDADSVEVWNYPWSSQYVPIIGSDAPEAVRWWERNYVARGARPAAVGGSDNHWRSTERIQGVGQPTTWVFARDKSLGAILDAIRAGRTTVSAEPPGFGGARLYLEADGDRDGGYESIVGDQVPAGEVALRVRVSGGLGNIVRVWAGGKRYEGTVTEDPATLTLTAPIAAGGWARAELLVPDASGERNDACEQHPELRGSQDQLNQTLTSTAEMFISGASEVRPVNTGPCTIVSMSALTSPIYAR